MATITRGQAVEYLDSLGDPVDWDNSNNNATGPDPWTLEEIRAEVIHGDAYDGGNIWPDLLQHYDAEDITPAA
jgi:hypothetical protein